MSDATPDPQTAESRAPGSHARVAPSAPTPLGIYDRNRAPQVTGIEIVAIALSAIWLLGAAVFFVVVVPGDSDTDGGLRFLMTLMAVFMPVGMIWVAATAARASKVMRDESTRLQTAIDALRHAYVSQSQGGTAGSSVARKLDEIAAAQRKAEATLAMFSSTREIGAHRAPTQTEAPRAAATSAAAPRADDQPTLALGTPAEALEPTLSNEDFIRALNFPETPEDRDGFAALRRALKHRPTAQLVQAAQDVLTLLSQDGIYMDDLRPDMAKPDVWRRFGEGARGRAIAGLGGVRDRSSLALTAGRMKQDPIFRDAAHHFLRVFDRTFQSFSERASDTEVSQFSNTRTSRAFMLLGRVAGTFD